MESDFAERTGPRGVEHDLSDGEGHTVGATAVGEGKVEDIDGSDGGGNGRGYGNGFIDGGTGDERTVVVLGGGIPSVLVADAGEGLGRANFDGRIVDKDCSNGRHSPASRG